MMKRTLIPQECFDKINKFVLENTKQGDIVKLISLKEYENFRDYLNSSRDVKKLNEKYTSFLLNAISLLNWYCSSKSNYKLKSFSEKITSIAIEGCDASGKETQTKMLFNNLNKVVDNVKLFSFPNYKSSSPNMTILKKILKGEFGPIDNIDPIVRASLFMADRKNTISEYLNETKDKNSDKEGIYIFDRYALSNVYNLDAAIAIPLEYGEDGFHNMVPDITIFLNSSMNFIENNIKERIKTNNGKVDEFEKKTNFQRIIREKMKNAILTINSYVSVYKDRLCIDKNILDINDEMNTIIGCYKISITVKLQTKETQYSPERIQIEILSKLFTTTLYKNNKLFIN